MQKLSRRTLLKNSFKYASAMTALGLMPGMINSDPTFDDEELELRVNADHLMVFGSPYDSENWRFSPHMHQEFKKNIQEMSNGRIFVDVMDKGQVGIGPSLMVGVARQNISAGLVSMSNLAPVAPELDLLNIPFWSSDNQSYINLVTSEVWNSLVLEKIKAKGRIQVLFHYAVGPRTATTVRSYGRLIKVPADVRGLQFRIPVSKVLEQFYNMAGATPRRIAWGKASEAARRKMYSALDPGLIGLYNGPDNLKDQLYAISRIQSVQDGWAAVISQDWLNSLPKDLQEVVHQASDKTFREQIKKAAEITERCIKYFELAGTSVYTPTRDEKQQWIDQCGYARNEWNPIKKKILGDVKLFDQLLDATQVNNGYTI